MKKKILSMLLALTMIVSLVAVTAISASADSENLQVCTDIVEVNGEGHESTSQLTADAWFEQTYGGIITDTDGTVSTFRVRGWANPLDGSDLLQFGYSLESDEIHWDDALKAPEAGLHSYFAKAERFDVTVNFDYLPVGDYEFHLYAKTSTGTYEVEEEAFVLEKQAATAGLTNVALNKTVIADRSMEAGFFSSIFINDGKNPPFESQTDPLGWTAGLGEPFFMKQDQEIYVYIDLGGKCEIGCIRVFPQLFLEGAGFPSSFSVLAGMDQSNLTVLGSVANINESAADATTDPTVFTFTPVVARFVALRVERASWLQQDGSYLTEVGEIEVIGKELPKDTFTATFKADGQVVGTVTFEEGAKSITAPDVPAKAGFTGAWESYTLANENIEINAIYTEIPAEETTAAEGETTVAEEETTVAEEETTVAEKETTTGAETEPGDTAVVGDVTTVAEAAATTVADAETTGKGGKSGCGGIVSVSALAIVALFGGAIVIKKRNG